MTARAGAAAGRRSRRRIRLGSLLYWLLGAAVVVGIAGTALHLRTFPPFATVLSSSMEPALDVGDVVVLQALDGPPEVGDIVRYEVGMEAREKAGYPATVVHRVIEVDRERGVVRTKGDNMESPDPFTIPISGIKGRVVLTVPQAGRLLGFFVSPFGLLWLALGVLLLVVLPFYDLHRERTDLEQLEVLALGEMNEKIDDISEVAEGARTVLVPEVLAPRADDEVKETLRELVGAVGEYGEHLRTHTAILRSMSEASRDLAAVAAELRDPRSIPTPPATPSITPDVLRHLRDTAPDGGGYADPAEIAFALGVERDAVEQAVAALVSTGLVVVDQRSTERLHYRMT